MGHRLFKDRAIGPVVETLFSLFLDHTPLCFDTYGVYFQVQHPFRFKPHRKFSPHTKATFKVAGIHCYHFRGSSSHLAPASVVPGGAGRG